MDENEITQRLRDAGRQQVPGDVRTNHLSRMGAVAPGIERPKRFGRFAVAAAAVVGFTVGSTGFAMAGALPDPAQGVAHRVLSVVQVEVPDRPDNHGQCVSEAMETLDPGATAEARKAAKADCPKGKPEGVGHGKPDHAGQGKGRPAHAGTPGGPKGTRPEWGDCKGPPPWAGKGGKGVSAEEKQAFTVARDACPDDEDEDEVEEQEAPELETETGDPQGKAEGRDDEAPGAEQRQAEPGADAPVETPPGPPADGAPGQQDDAGTPPVDVPTPDQPDTDTDTDAG